MIIEGLEGVAPLTSIYKSLNQEYFGNVLPSIPVKWSGKLKTSIGIAMVRYKGSKKIKGSFEKYMSEIPVADVQIVDSSLTIKLSKTFDLELPDIKGVLLHEMVHILLYTKKKLGQHHGTPEFDGWIKKLRAESGYNVPLKESDFKKSPKLKAKDGMVMLIFLMSDTTPGVSVYSKNFFIKQWGDFMRRMARQVAHSSKVERLEIYKISHPIVSAMGARRTSNGLSWQQTDDITVKEIQRGQQFMYVDKGGGSITPKVAGITTDRLDVNKKYYFNTEGVVGV